MVKRVAVVLFGLSAHLIAAEGNITSEANATLLSKQLQKAMEQEKKFAKEQKFYDADSYDFREAEVNKESLKHIEVPQMDDAEMDSSAMLGMDDDENLSW